MEKEAKARKKMKQERKKGKAKDIKR